MNKDKLKEIRDNYTLGVLADVLDAILEEEPEQWIPPDGCPVYVGDNYQHSEVYYTLKQILYETTKTNDL